MSDTTDAKPGAGPDGAAPDQVILDKTAQSANGKVKAGIKVTKVSEPAAGDDAGCEDCGQEESGTGRALGVVLLSAAGFLLYMGLDLVTRGGLSRWLAGGRPDDGDE